MVGTGGGCGSSVSLHSVSFAGVWPKNREKSSLQALQSELTWGFRDFDPIYLDMVVDRRIKHRSKKMESNGRIMSNKPFCRLASLLFLFCR